MHESLVPKQANKGAVPFRASCYLANPNMITRARCFNLAGQHYRLVFLESEKERLKARSIAGQRLRVL